MSLRFRPGRACGLCACALVLSCFSDATGAGSATASTAATTDDCTVGDRGCPCYGNATCNDDLICLEGIACFPADCVSGTQACPCLAGGGCDLGLVCTGTQCLPGGTSGTSDTTTSTTSASGEPTLTSVGPTGPETTDASETTGMGSCRAAAGDLECEQCAKAECCIEYEACAEDPECANMLGCIQHEVGQAECAQLFDETTEAYQSLAACLLALPLGHECRGCGPPSSACVGDLLDGAAVFWSCNECAALLCCPELTVCENDPGCACLAQCLADPATLGDLAYCQGLMPCNGLPQSENYSMLSDCADSMGCLDVLVGDPCFPPA